MAFGPKVIPLFLFNLEPPPTMPTRRAAGWLRSFYKLFTFYLALFPLCRAVLVNKTIDSFYGDTLTGFIPQYNAPKPAWDDQTCFGCFIQPDPALSFDGTWMAATYHPELRNVNFTLEFTGVAIYVFFILSNANKHGPGTTTNTQCNFTLDGQDAGSFSHEPDMSTFDLEYNVTVFSRTSLTNTSHQLTVSVNDFPNATFINFDWAIYTMDLIESPSTDTNSSSTSTQSPSTSIGSSAIHNAASPQLSSQRTAIIVGCVLGVIVVAIIAILLFSISRLRRSQKKYNGATSRGVLEIDDFPGETSRVVSHYRDPSNSYLASSGASQISADNVRPFSNQGSVRKVPPTRQMEVIEHLRSAYREMDQLTAAQGAQQASDRSTISVRSQQEIGSLRDQLQELRNRIEYLRHQGQPASDWASGLSDEQPPAYV